MKRISKSAGDICLSWQRREGCDGEGFEGFAGGKGEPGCHFQKADRACPDSGDAVGSGSSGKEVPGVEVAASIDFH